MYPSLESRSSSAVYSLITLSHVAGSVYWLFTACNVYAYVGKLANYKLSEPFTMLRRSCKQCLTWMTYRAC